MENYEEVIKAFHMMWDGFPGLARLIDKDHVVIAANPMAEEKGFTSGVVCAKLEPSDMHRGCKKNRMFQTGVAQTDRVMQDRVRGWMPVQGWPELMVHFAVLIPEE